MPDPDKSAQGRSELRAAKARLRPLFMAVVLFSVFVNLLMLTSPLFMMQVYDRVLASGSEATLVSLFGLVVFLFSAMAVLDIVRIQVMSRAGSRFQAALDRRVFDAALTRQEAGTRPAGTERDLDQLRQFAASPVFFALVDMPGTPLFLAAIFLLHPLLGLLAVAGGAILLAVALLNQSMTARRRQEATTAGQSVERLSTQFRSEAATIRALGMRGAAHDRWQEARVTAVDASIGAGDLGSVFGSFTKVFRQFLQSAMLAFGAWLVLGNAVSPGAMIASSVLLGRALAPIETLVGQWSMVQGARQSWDRLAELLSGVPPKSAPMPLARPQARLEVESLSVAPPGERVMALQAVSFAIEPGQALGVIGPSAAGKSTLARAVGGIWPAAGGSVRLGGALQGQYDSDVYGGLVGYLPQRSGLFDGTIAENIARFTTGFDPAAVRRAAEQAGAHQMILSLPAGYDTRVTAEGGRLSGGQVQRIGLARAMFDDPVLLVLDEPNSNLDNEGSMAVNAAIRDFKARGGIVLIMAHRPSALQECDLLLMLEGGRRRAFGPRDEVLRETIRNSAQVLRTAAPGGVA